MSQRHGVDGSRSKETGDLANEALAKSGTARHRTVAVLGCGVIGSSWVEAFLTKGLKVRAWDPKPGLANRLESQSRQHPGLLETVQSADEAVVGASFIQENGPEDLGLKRSLLTTIAPFVDDDAVLASSSSTLQPTDIQQGSPVASRIIIGHPFNPPHIIPLVEVVGGRSTSEAAITKAMDFYRLIGKHPIHLARERPGHLANRLQAALWREALDAVQSGQATVADVDAAVTLALGPRWAISGPFATFHMGGGSAGLQHFLDHIGIALEALWDDSHRPQMTEAFSRQIVDEVVKAVDHRSPEDLLQARDKTLRSIFRLLSDKEKR